MKMIYVRQKHQLVIDGYSHPDCPVFSYHLKEQRNKMSPYEHKGFDGVAVWPASNPSYPLRGIR